MNTHLQRLQQLLPPAVGSWPLQARAQLIPVLAHDRLRQLMQALRLDLQGLQVLPQAAHCCLGVVAVQRLQPKGSRQ